MPPCVPFTQMKTYIPNTAPALFAQEYIGGGSDGVVGDALTVSPYRFILQMKELAFRSCTSSPIQKFWQQPPLSVRLQGWQILILTLNWINFHYLFFQRVKMRFFCLCLWSIFDIPFIQFNPYELTILNNYSDNIKRHNIIFFVPTVLCFRCLIYVWLFELRHLFCFILNVSPGALA